MGEFFLFYKNLGNIRDDTDLPVSKRVSHRLKLAYNILKDKITVDPLQEVVVSENVLAITGVCIPIITSSLCYTTGHIWFDTVGEIMNGIVQLYLGKLIMFDNAGILLGKSIPETEARVTFT